MRNGLLFRFAYTYSKAIDNVNSEVFVTSGGASRASNLLIEASTEASRAFTYVSCSLVVYLRYTGTTARVLRDKLPVCGR